MLATQLLSLRQLIHSGAGSLFSGATYIDPTEDHLIDDDDERAGGTPMGAPRPMEGFDEDDLLAMSAATIASHAPTFAREVPCTVRLLPLPAVTAIASHGH